MALTYNNLEIIKALSKNDIHAAKVAALKSLAEDKSKKNEGVISYYKKLLTANSSTLLTNLPSNLQAVLVGAAPHEFNPDRYFLCDNEKIVLDTIIKMRKVAEELSKRNLDYKNTTLLSGTSGVGKTEFAKYIAYKLGLPYFYISFANTIDSYMGRTAKNINKIFEFVKSIPCVLLLDEVDAISTKRTFLGGKGVDGEIERTTISIMQELDKLPNHVTLIAATNRLDLVDEAMYRRFSIHHTMVPMTNTEKEAMIKQYLQTSDCEKYVSDSKIKDLVDNYKSPGEIIPELIKLIGDAVYDEIVDTLMEEPDEIEDINLWEVTCTWKTNIVAETEEDAVSIARKDRYNKPVEEVYTVKRAEYIYNE